MFDLVDVPMKVLVELKDRLVRMPGLRNAYDKALNAREFADYYEHDRMLADRVRMTAYQRAITEHVMPGQTVLDLGTGNGVLALLCAAQGAEVHAVDHSPIIAAAQSVAEANGLARRIHFHRMHSQRLVLPQKVDVIIHEQLGDALFNERLVENLMDARARLLKPKGRILPARFQLFVEPVCLRPEFRTPFLWTQKVGPVDFSSLRSRYTSLPPSYFRKLIRQNEVEALLCKPAPVLSVDLDTLDAEQLPTSLSYRREVRLGGMLDGFVVYFRAAFDEHNAFDTGPGSPRTHWGMMLLRVEPQTVRAGDLLTLQLSVPRLEDVNGWRWRVAAT
ncbi:50S ribosomal protein L11 methyltransferase [Corallococcus sp. M34]|uniref:methyltransferase domain-containing protein n=1 Tax=Citreicoccus inhibens TaxID=2849499 RepID=UPI0013159346|nr:methyltransferase domain-containing protein [Citreicoccus inhibens]MBU8900024.1 50S ribosomal protein L11 methyltransferase [Citreicoccus inhibens]